MEYRPTIGLEIHAELKTKTKMFCDSKNDPDETRPNVNVCPICMAHPGTLPVINRQAVEHIVRIGTAIGGTIADFTEFDRKSYFYPDIPKGYQISQYKYPLVSGGELAGVQITRVHLEEDTARSTHAKGKSLVDFNRAGIPLMELVTEPVISDAETAGKFARELQLLLRTLGAGEANLEKGEMRIEANISVSNEEGKYGTKVEVKNINSFRSVERAIAFEIKRQAELIESGGKVVQETRGWDEGKQVTFHQRFKEGSADYRYFPEPDLPKLYLSLIPEFAPDVVRASLPELPRERRARYKHDYAATIEEADILLQNESKGKLFDEIVHHENTNTKLISISLKLITQNDVSAPAASVLALAHMISGNTISSTAAKIILTVLNEKGGDPAAIAQEEGLLQIHDTEALADIVRTMLTEEEKAVEEYKTGKQAALQYLIGKAMKKSRGAGNPAMLGDIISKLLS